MIRYYIGLDEDEARQIEDWKAKYEDELATKITASKFIRKLIFSGIEKVVFGGPLKSVEG